MALQPVGPLPASTYWRRRVLLLVVAILLLLLAARACGGSASKDTLASSAATPAGSPAAAGVPPSPVAPAAPSAPATSAPSALTASATAPPSSTPPLQTCSDNVLQVTTQADAQAYPSGGKPRFTLTVRNIGSVPCRRALGPGAVEVRVFSGEDRIWSSADCDDSKEQGVLTLPAGQARATTVLWSGMRSKPGCVTGNAAQPGTYRVSARVGDLIREGSVFRITG